MTRGDRGGLAIGLLAAALMGLVALPRAQSSGAMSEAERRYVAPRATERVAEGPRTATLAPGYGRKFSAENTAPRVTIPNPYLNPARPLFARAEALQCMADGGVMVSGRAGFDPDGRALGTGFWRIAPDGAITPVQTRSNDAYPLTRQTTCGAPFGKSMAGGPLFTVAADGRIIMSTPAAVLAVGADGRVTRIAGPERGLRRHLGFAAGVLGRWCGAGALHRARTAAPGSGRQHLAGGSAGVRAAAHLAGWRGDHGHHAGRPLQRIGAP